MTTADLLEVELRAKIEDESSIIDKLNSLGAYHAGKFTQDDDYFKCSGDIERKLLFRIREKDGTFKLTLKGISKQESGIGWDEWEQDIADSQGLKSIFLANDYTRVVRISKRRATYHLPNAEINIDVVDNLGKFVEVEVMASTVEEGKDIAFRLLKDLGVNAKSIISRGYVPLMLEKLKSSS